MDKRHLLHQRLVEEEVEEEVAEEAAEEVVEDSVEDMRGARETDWAIKLNATIIHCRIHDAVTLIFSYRLSCLLED